MPVFTKYPKIEQFRSVVSDIKYHYGDAVDAPSVQFIGTVKLHGTNSGVGWDGQNLIVQSRNRSITVEKDNSKFAAFVHSKLDIVKSVVSDVHAQATGDRDLSDTPLYLYGEWCGRGIQSGVAISEVSPKFVIFGAAYREKEVSDGDNVKTWLPNTVFANIPESLVQEWNHNDIYHIYQFPYWIHSVKFAQPELGQAQNYFAKLTEEVETECPVAKHFGVSGVGEGIVWIGQFLSPRDHKVHNLRFKVKGDKHSVSKVKKLAAVDVDKLKGVIEFIDYAVTENRMIQGYNELFGETSPEMKDLGQLIRWVRDDVLAEEADTMAASSVTKGDIGKELSGRVRNWFMGRIN